MAAEHPRREPWPWIVAGLLAAMIGSSLAFLRVAVANPDPLVVEDAYRAGREYSERVRAARRAEDLGWEVALVSRPDAGGVGLRVDVLAGDVPVAVERVSVRRVRPAEGGLDADFPLAADDAGWSGRVPLPRTGRWHLVVRAEAGDEAVERTFAWWAR